MALIFQHYLASVGERQLAHHRGIAPVKSEPGERTAEQERRASDPTKSDGACPRRSETEADQAPDDLKEYAIVAETVVPIREVRVGVTMVGGIALAIYENGAAQELFRMVQGEGVYGLIKRLTHSHVLIDILSGTSAGGINTIFMSAALTMKRDMAPTRDTWITVGGIDELLQNPLDSQVAALLQGDRYYIERLTDAFWVVRNTPLPPPAGIRSGIDGTGHYRDLDLFVTGTYYIGRPRTFFDARNRPIFTDDYHGLFHLKHRPRREESHFDPCLCDPLNTRFPPQPPADRDAWPAADPRQFPALREKGVIDRLARIARTTSSLPAAFEPSRVEAWLMNGVIELPQEHEINYIMDGGFLNNRPLDLALQAILERPSAGEVARKVFFVEPTPDQFQPPTTQEPQPPSALQNLWFYKDVPGRQSLVGCLDAIYDHNRKVRHLKETLGAVHEMVRRSQNGREHPGAASEAISWLERRRRSLSRSSGGRADSGPSPEQARLWVKIRLQELRDQLIAAWEQEKGLEGFEGLIHDSMPLTTFVEQLPMAQALRALRTRLLTLMENHCAELRSPPRPAEPEAAGPPDSQFTLREVDYSYLTRKIMRTIEAVRWVMYPDPNFVEAFAGTNAQSAFQEVFHHLTEKSYRQVQQELGELYHLRDLAEIIVENLGRLMAGLADSVEFKEAACKRSFQTEEDLWFLLVGCVRSLLRLEKLDDWPKRTGAPGAAGASGAGALERDNTDRLRGELRKRSGELCAALRGCTAADKEQRDRWKAEGRRPVPAKELRSVVTRIEECVHEIACELTTPLRPAKVPLPWAQAAGGGSPTHAALAAIGACLDEMDVYLYPIERAAAMVSLDEIELVHISPRDVQVGFSNRPAAEKLAGDVYAHFGGFLKRSWRANDIMWGRLDAAGAITASLLERDRLARLLEKKDGSGDTDLQVAAQMMRAIDSYLLHGSVRGERAGGGAELGECDLSHPPPLPEGRCDSIGRCLGEPYDRSDGQLSPRQRLWRYLCEGYREAPAWDRDPGLDELVEWLLKRHQLAIIEQEMPTALAEAASEHVEWEGLGEAEPALDLFVNRPEESDGQAAPASAAERRRRIQAVVQETREKLRKGRRAGAAARLAWLARVCGSGPDPVVRTALREQAARWIRQEFESPGADREELNARRIVRYFRGDYRIGDETVEEDIPLLVMVRRFVSALLIALHVFEQAMSDKFKQGQMGKLLARWVLTPISLVTTATYGFLMLLAQGPSLRLATHAAVWVVILVGWITFFLGFTAQVPLVLAVLILATILEVVYWHYTLVVQRRQDLIVALHLVAWLLILGAAVPFCLALQHLFKALASASKSTTGWPPLWAELLMAAGGLALLVEIVWLRIQPGPRRPAARRLPRVYARARSDDERQRRIRRYIQALEPPVAATAGAVLGHRWRLGRVRELVPSRTEEWSAMPEEDKLWYTALEEVTRRHELSYELVSDGPDSTLWLVPRH